MEKKEIWQEVRGVINLDELEGSLDKVVATINSIPKRFRDPNNSHLRDLGKTTHRYELELSEWEGESSWPQLTVRCYRWETDEEFTKRKEEENVIRRKKDERKRNLKRAKEQRERTIYEKLKKKFG